MYFLEGNIGVGKTTLISLIPRYWSDLTIIPEPVGIWNRSVLGQSLLANFYINPKRWAYTLETLTLICRSQDHLREQRLTNPNLLLERSIYSGHYCFAATGFENGFLIDIEWKIYNQWADFLIHKKCTPPHGFIYLKASPEVCFERTQKRSLPAEHSITLKYLKQIDRAHQLFLVDKEGLPHVLKQIPVLVIDCNEDFLENPRKMADHAEKIREFFAHTQIDQNL